MYRFAYYKPKEQLRITAHEMLINHISNILRDKIDNLDLDLKNHFWAITELVANSILGISLNYL